MVSDLFCLPAELHDGSVIAAIVELPADPSDAIESAADSDLGSLGCGRLQIHF